MELFVTKERAFNRLCRIICELALISIDTIYGRE